VVICNTDPNPQVSGKGIEKLRGAGIEVITHVLEKEGAELNKRFFTFHQKKRPYYILKWAQTADGYISRLPVPDKRTDNIISTDEHLKEVHKLRSEEMGIMIGKNTVLADNPHLTTRFVKGANPVRIFIDRKLEVPPTFNIYNGEAKTIVFNEIKSETKENIRFIQVDFSKSVLAEISNILFQNNIQSVIVEGGLKLLNDFIFQGLYDEIRIFENKSLFFGHGIKAPDVKPGPDNK
jgi:diaminohydroxyphosphoribosylaminopyrimidine deaminase/5-amino-6-(5-phosphoribosylamino)uracil reductase